MKVTIYGYGQGRIEHYNTNLIKDENPGCALELVVELPDELNPYTSVMGDICIDYKGYRVCLNDLLFADKNGEPWIEYYDMNKCITHRLKEVANNGWKSTAMYL